MSEQTYLSLYLSEEKDIAKADIKLILQNLHVEGDVDLTRYDGPANNWNLFKTPWLNYPDYELLTQVPQFERADAVWMRVERDFHAIFGTTFSIILDWRGIWRPRRARS
jgi:hypothetical protein